MTQTSIAGQLAIKLPSQPAPNPLRETCPRCAAPPGEPCMTDTGEEAHYEHVARRRLAAYVPLEA